MLHRLPVHGHNGDAAQIGGDGVAFGVIKGGGGGLDVLGLHRRGQLGTDSQGGYGVGDVSGVDVVVDGVVTVRHVGVCGHLLGGHGPGNQGGLALLPLGIAALAFAGNDHGEIQNEHHNCKDQKKQQGL